MEFFRSNILLIGLAIGSGFMLLLPLFKKSAGGVPNLTAAEAVTLINRSNAFVLDVRDATEFASGHIAEATHIPLADLAARIGELKKYQNKTILVNCQRGMRSAKACDILRKAEFTQVNNLHGGLNAWLEAKLPTVTNSTATNSTANNSKVTANKSAGTKSTAIKSTGAAVKKVASNKNAAANDDVAKLNEVEAVAEVSAEANINVSNEKGAV